MDLNKAMSQNAFRRIVSVVRRPGRRAHLKYHVMLDESDSAEESRFAKNSDDVHYETTGNLHCKEPFIVLDFLRFAEQGISVLTENSAYENCGDGEVQMQCFPRIRIADTAGVTASTSSDDGTVDKAVPTAFPKLQVASMSMDLSTYSTSSVVDENSQQANRRALTDGHSVSSDFSDAASLYTSEETLRSDCEQFPSSFVAAIQGDMNRSSIESSRTASGSLFTSDESVCSWRAKSTLASF